MWVLQTSIWGGKGILSITKGKGRGELQKNAVPAKRGGGSVSLQEGGERSEQFFDNQVLNIQTRGDPEKVSGGGQGRIHRALFMERRSGKL